ncbi:MAG: response regulator transcription factor [Acidobacteria bacterium]|nr:response regulator transcription factor [Acidobacteriota bacterium]
MIQNASIIIADDHPVFRRGLKMVVESEAGLTVVAEASDGAEALAAVEAKRPDLIVLDVNMPQMNGFDVVREMRNRRLKSAIVFLTMHRDEEMFNAAMDLGVGGFILKDGAVTEIVDCLKTVLRGQPYISPQLSAFLLNRNRTAAEFRRQNPALEKLTPTELRILKLISEYKTSKEIAAILCIHSRTVDNHRTNICQKINLKGNHALLKFAVEHKSSL